MVAIYTTTLIEDYMWKLRKSNRDYQPEIDGKCFLYFNGEYTLLPKSNSVSCGGKNHNCFDKLLFKTNH